MTVIVAARTAREGIVMAADSETTFDWTKTQGDHEKLWVDQDGGYLFGACGSVRAAQAVRFGTSWPKYEQGRSDSPMAFGVESVVPAIRTGVEDMGVMYKQNDSGYVTGGDTINTIILMAWGEHLIRIDEDFSITIPPNGVTAIGSGEGQGLGALPRRGPWTRAMVIEAVRRASDSAVGVGGPIYVASTKTLKIELVTA